MRIQERILVSVLVLLLYGCTKPEEKVQNYLASAKSLIEQGKLEKAKLDLKSALQIDGQQEQAFYYLALIDQKNHNWPSMYRNLNQVIRINSKHKDAHILLSRLFLLSEEYAKAEEQTSIVLDQSPNDSDALLQKGMIFYKQSKLQEAMAIVKQVLATASDNADASFLKATILTKEKNYDEALQVIDGIHQTKPNELPLYQLKIEIYTQMKLASKVEATLFEVIKRFPEQKSLLLLLAKHYANNNQGDKALETLNQMVKEEPANLENKLALLDFLIINKPALFESQAQEFLKARPETPEIYLRLAQFYVKEKNLDKAKQSFIFITEHVKTDSKEGLSAKFGLASLAIENKDTEQALKWLKEVLAVDAKNYQAMLLKANIDASVGAYNDAIAEYREIVRDFPKSDEAYEQLAKVYAKTNSPQLANENYRKAFDINPSNFNAVISVVSEMVKKNDLDRAEEMLLNVLKKTEIKDQADLIPVVESLAHIGILKKDWASTQAVADQIAEKAERKPLSIHYKGIIFEGQHKYTDAIHLYQLSLEQLPANIQALEGMARSYAELKQLPKLKPFLDKFATAYPQKWQPVILKAKIFLAKNNNDQAIQVLQTAIVNWPKELALYEALAKIYASKNELNKIEEVYQKALTANPDNAPIRLFLAMAYAQNKHYQNALDEYAVLAKIPANQSVINKEVIINNQASILLDHFATRENISEALALASAFKTSSQPYLLDTYGWALAKSEQYNEALKVLKKNSQDTPEVAIFHQHLGYVYAKLNNKTEAVNELKQAQTLAKKQGDVSLQTATAHLLKSVEADKTPTL